MNEQIQFIGTTPEILCATLEERLIPELEQRLAKRFQPIEPPKYLTRKDVCEIFQIDLSTLYRWTKEGRLSAYGIGNRVYYLRSEVDEKILSSKINSVV